MLQSLIIALDWFGICVFAVSGALVASRKQMDIVGFAMLGSVTGIGGGTNRVRWLGGNGSIARYRRRIGLFGRLWAASCGATLGSYTAALQAKGRT